MKNIDLQQRFESYFQELEGFSLRAERFYDDLEVSPVHRRQLLATNWLKAAFLEGARVMAQDTIDTLGDYGTYVAGIDDECYTATESFDMASASLQDYYTQVFKE